MAELKLKRLLELIQKLDNEHQGATGWMFSSSRNAVNYSGYPDAMKQVQRDLDHVGAGLQIVYLFSLLQVYFSAKHWRKWLEPDELERLFAYHHIRHSIAHRIDGKRVGTGKVEFERVMKSKNGLPDIYWDQKTDLVRLGGTAGVRLLQELQHLSRQIVSRVANTSSSK